MWIRKKLGPKLWRYRWVATALTLVKLAYEFFVWMGWWTMIAPALSLIGTYLLGLGTPLGVFGLMSAAVGIWFTVTVVQFLRWRALAHKQAATADISTADRSLLTPRMEDRQPFDVEAKSAFIYAANRSWHRPTDRELARELEGVLNALALFYDLASNNRMRVWGRRSASRPLRPIEPDHWEHWEIRHADVFDTAEPIRTVPRDRLPADGGPYYDLHLNRNEVEQTWPAGDKAAEGDTLYATGVLHGGKLTLELPDLSGDGPVIGHELRGPVSTVTLTVSVFNEDFHRAFEGVNVKIVNYCLAHQADLRPFGLDLPLSPMHGETVVNPRDRLTFNLAISEDDGTVPHRPVRRFLLGGRSGQVLGIGEYIVTLSFSARGHSRKTEKVRLAVGRTDLGISFAEQRS